MDAKHVIYVDFQDTQVNREPILEEPSHACPSPFLQGVLAWAESIVTLAIGVCTVISTIAFIAMY
ncbi:MAG: hypothetical protein PHS97_00350 [Oscillospiraceae bacterium]|nr:hypothetical protein [Oscillospiraceae bacterium]